MSPQSRESGQILLVAILILVFLLISIPVLVYVNQMNTQRHVSVVRTNKGLGIAEEGIAHALRDLEQGTNFQTVINGGPMTGWTNPFQSANGGYYQLSLNQALPGRKPYQVVVLAVAYALPEPGEGPMVTLPNGLKVVAIRSIRAIISQTTLGIRTVAGVNASCALEMVTAPGGGSANYPDALTVHWGPVVILDENSLWTLYNPMNSIVNTPPPSGYPRKFSQGGIQGAGSVAGSPPSYYRVPDRLATSTYSDLREYWAFTPLGFNAFVDDSAYDALAGGESGMQDLTTMGPPRCVSGAPGACSNPGFTGRYASGGAIFDAAYTLPPAPSTLPPNYPVIHVLGDAVFNDLALDLGETGAMIIDGNLTLGTNAIGSGLNPNLTLFVPESAKVEYPATNPPYAFPCDGQTGGTCSSAVATTALPGALNKNLSFRGFLWVKGNLIIPSLPPPGVRWNFAGTVLIGNPQVLTTRPIPTSAVLAATQGLQVNNPSQISIFYDANVNHNILVNPLQLQIDRTEDVSI